MRHGIMMSFSNGHTRISIADMLNNDKEFNEDIHGRKEEMPMEENLF